MTGMRETILAAARATAQAHGYAGLSFRELAKAVGIKSASIHYHFPAKADLEAVAAASPGDPGACLRAYAAIFRRALENGNRMCLCNFLAAETDDLPEAVRAEVRAFADLNVAWLARVLSPDDPGAAERQALAIFAAVGGAQLAARSRGDAAVYDRIVEAYRAAGLIPD